MLVESCSDCHSAARPSAGFSVANFERLWAGGNSGPAVEPGNAQASLLVQKLLGTANDGDRMPQNRPAWSEQQIAVVEKWIDEGASFDGPSTTESTARVAAVVKASRTTPEQLSTEREQRAEDVWRLAIPDESASCAVSQQFLAIGNVPEPVLEQLLGAAESQASAVVAFFKQPDQPLNRARVTLFALGSRIDYSEFGTMVERRSVPPEARGHSRFDLVHPYVALVVDDASIDTLDRRLATCVATLWVADQSQDRLPDWFTTGAGMAAAARLHAKDPEVRRWREELPTAVAALTEPDAFMTGKLPPRSSELLSFGFVDALSQNPANFHRLVKAAATTNDFDAACQQVFQRSQKEVAATVGRVPATRAVGPCPIGLALRRLPLAVGACRRLFGGHAHVETELPEHRSQSRRPLRVARVVGVQEVGKLLGLGVACFIGEQGVGVEHRDLLVVLHRLLQQTIQPADLIGRAILLGGTRHHQAQDHRHIGVVFTQSVDDQVHVAGDYFGRCPFIEVVGAHQHHHTTGVEFQHVVVESNQHAAGGVAADAAVGGLDAGQFLLEYFAPSLGNRVAEHDEGSLILLHLSRPLAAAVPPQILEPLVPTYRAGAGKPFVGFRDGERIDRCFG